jgi:peptidoglycan/LPS O-acetylase OafA/YrhL
VEELEFMQNSSRIIPALLQTLSIIALVYLAVLLMGDWDIVATKNDHFAAEAKIKIDNNTSIDSVKVAAKMYVDRNRNSFSMRSDESFYRFWIVILIIAIQLVLIGYRRALANKPR